MAGVQDAALAVAVAQAGGMASLPCAMLGPAQIAAQVEQLRDASAAPFNLNFFCHEPPDFDADQQARWMSALAPALEQYGIDPSAVPVEPSRRPFDEAACEQVLDLRPTFVSFHFGLPAPALVEALHSAGICILSTATTVAEARWLEERGADGIIAQGLEAGGHRGMFLTDDLSSQLPTFTLLEGVLSAVDVPVIAAGGLGNAQAVRRAIALGAIAVQVGTAYLLADEATTSPLHRRALREAVPEDVVLTNVFSGRPARGIRNHAMRFLGEISPEVLPFPLAGNAMGLLRQAAEREGRSDFSPLWSGVFTGAPPTGSAGAITRELVAELGKDD